MPFASGSSRHFIAFKNTFLLLLASTTVLSILSSNCCVHASQRLSPSTSFLHKRATAMAKGATTTTTTAESTVLRELKETIEKQAKEIEALKADVGGRFGIHSASPGVAHGHGGGEVSTEDVAKYLREPFYRTSLARVGWLAIFLASLSATAVIMNTFEHTLEKHIELSYFVPLLAGHGGNTGGQTIGTVLSALSSGAIKPKDAGRVILKEGAAGIMSGLLLGFMVAPVAYKFLGISFHVATVLFCTMPLVSTIASSLGASIPFVCIFAGLDPSVIAAPAMTSFVDICGLMSYFMIANYIFKLYGLEL